MKKLKEMCVNHPDAVRWGLHPEFITSANKVEVYFVGGYPRLRVLGKNTEVLYDEFAS